MLAWGLTNVVTGAVASPEQDKDVLCLNKIPVLTIDNLKKCEEHKQFCGVVDPINNPVVVIPYNQIVVSCKLSCGRPYNEIVVGPFLLK